MKKLLFIILLCFDFIAFNQATIFHSEVFIDDFQSMEIQKGYHSEKLIFSKIAKGYDNQTFYEKLSRLAEKSGLIYLFIQIWIRFRFTAILLMKFIQTSIIIENIDAILS